jgi:hypothetical protein
MEFTVAQHHTTPHIRHEICVICDACLRAVTPRSRGFPQRFPQRFHDPA